MPEGDVLFAMLCEFRDVPVDGVVDVDLVPIEQDVEGDGGDALADRKNQKASVVGGRPGGIRIGERVIFPDCLMEDDIPLVSDARLQGRVFPGAVQVVEGLSGFVEQTSIHRADACDGR
jgi:hypothetical protein